jgi:hypothetical protein
MTLSIRRYIASRRLARMVEQRRNSPEIVSYREHREAAKKGWARKRRFEVRA